ncbi:phage portal protein [Streptomyces sp. H27-D2]|uniref:phage portal protein n=1 Tax=Streptomyces sp. H27-D2 TaxID=3046304 RepID=UPI002DB87257|nr:phage portal protein [Streptomyces sp. H27-D2]MEC4016085.1 phage portal protein [Streptomyces sp. H27-D2]
MPLPPSGKTVWPPVQYATPFADMDIWHAWYSGDIDHLRQVYGGAMSVSANPAARSFFDLNRPSQMRGGLVGSLARMFWGQPLTPGQPPSKLHIPVGGDLAELSANLLWADAPSISADAASTSDMVATTDQLRRYLDDRGHAKMREAAEIGAALGGVYLRVVWDQNLKPRPWLDVVYPDAAVPEWRWGELSAVTVWRELAGQDDAHWVWRLLERHEPGTIEYGLYRGNTETLGMLMALDDHPDAADLASRVRDGGVQDTGVDRMLVTYVPNIRPSRMWRGLPDAEPLGRSDYAGVEPVMDALDEAWTSWMRDLRLGKARIMLPQSLLETDGPGAGATFDIDREVFVNLNMLDDGGSAITATQFAIRVDEHERTTKALRRQIYSSAGYSAQSMGEEGTVAVTATEVAARKEESLTTRGLKILYQRPALIEVMTTLLLVDKTIFKAQVDPEAELTASWPQAVQPDQEATARSLALLESAGAISTWMKVKSLRPEWDDEEVAEEVQRIREDKTASMPAGDPFNRGGPLVPVDPEADPEGEVPDAGSDPGEDDPEADGEGGVRDKAA